MTGINKPPETLEILRASKMLLRLAGLLPPEATSKYISIMYKLYTVLIGLLLVSALVGIGVVGFLCKQNMLLTTYSMFWLMSFYIVILNFIHFLYKRGTIMELADYIQKHHVRNIASEYVKYIRKGEMMYLKMLLSRFMIDAVLLSFIIVTQVLASSDEQSEEKDKEENITKYTFAMKRLVIMMWTPLDIENDTADFLLTYGINCVYATCISLVDVSTDTVKFSLITHLSAQFEMLTAMISDINDNLAHKQNQNYAETKPDLEEEEFKKYLQNCIQKHQNLLE